MTFLANYGFFKLMLRVCTLSHATQTLRVHFWRAGMLTVDEKSTPPAAETSLHQTKEVKHWNYRMQAINLNWAQYNLYAHVRVHDSKWQLND